jgi:GNAT superfamily N-acetyltransferase
MIEAIAPLRTAPAIRIRPVAPDDLAALRAFYADLSPDSRYRRLMSLGLLGERDAKRFCGADHEHREGFLAILDEAGPEDGAIVGHLCVEPVTSEEIEMAVAVADRFQGRGIGRALTHAALDWARTHGIARLRASMLADNAGIIRLLESLHRPITFSAPAAGVIEAVVEVDDPPFGS